MTIEDRILYKIKRWESVLNARLKLGVEDHYAYLAMGRVQAYREILKLITQTGKPKKGRKRK